MISMDAFGDEIDPDLARAMGELEAAAVERGLVGGEGVGPVDGANRANGSKVYVKPQASASGMPPARASVRKDWLSKWEADHE